jgi:putative transposase
VDIKTPNFVWSTDITYIRLKTGFMYLVAVIDWYSRYVLSWELSNTLDANFCVDALKMSLSQGQPTIFNTDQGSQFTSYSFTDVLAKNGIQISMDGKGRALDNVFVERLWRSVKYEDIYIKQYETGDHLYSGLSTYFNFYNRERPHQSLGYKTPFEIHSSQN